MSVRTTPFPHLPSVLKPALVWYSSGNVVSEVQVNAAVQAIQSGDICTTQPHPLPDGCTPRERLDGFTPRGLGEGVRTVVKDALVVVGNPSGEHTQQSFVLEEFPVAWSDVAAFDPDVPATVETLLFVRESQGV